MNKSTAKHSQGIALSHLFLLYISTCGLYFFYWFYKTTRSLADHHQLDKNAGLYTLGLLVPLLNIYLLWRLFKDIQQYSRRAGSTVLKYPGWLALLFLALSGLYRLPALYSFLGFSSVLPILYLQSLLNLYWQKEQPERPLRTRLNWIEIVICLLGTTLLTLAVFGAGLNTTQN